MDSSDIFSLCDRVRQTSFELHQYLRHGHLEKVYENGLASRFRKMDLRVGNRIRSRYMTRTTPSWAITSPIF